MNLFPRNYTVDVENGRTVVYFRWAVPGCSIRGVWIVAKYLSWKLNAAIRSKVQTPFESQFVLAIGHVDISIYQEDGEGIDVRVISEDGEATVLRIIRALDESIFFRHRLT